MCTEERVDVTFTSYYYHIITSEQQLKLTHLSFRKLQ